MRCANNTLVYVCTNATGTACIKSAVTLPLVQPNTVCTGSQSVLLNPAEYQSFVTQLNTATSTANTANTQSNTALQLIDQGLNLKVLPYAATDEDYSSISLLFVSFLVAGSIIWGAKMVLKQFHSHPEA